MKKIVLFICMLTTVNNAKALMATAINLALFEQITSALLARIIVCGAGNAANGVSL